MAAFVEANPIIYRRWALQGEKRSQLLQSRQVRFRLQAVAPNIPLPVLARRKIQLEPAQHILLVAVVMHLAFTSLCISVERLELIICVCRHLVCKSCNEPCDTRLIFTAAAPGSSPASALPLRHRWLPNVLMISQVLQGHSTHCCAYLQGTGTQTHGLSNQLTHSPSTYRRDSDTVAKAFRERTSTCFIFLISSASAFARSSFVHFSSDFSSSLLLRSRLRITRCLNSLSKSSF